MIGKLIKKIREESGLSKKDVAKILDIETTSMSNVENGSTNFSDEILIKLSNIFKVDPELLLNEEKNKDKITDANLNVGSKIKFYRQQNGMTQKDLAAELGYADAPPICLIESGKRGMSKKQLLKCAELFHVHISTLLSQQELDSADTVLSDFIFLKTNIPTDPVLAVISKLITETAMNLRCDLVRDRA